MVDSVSGNIIGFYDYLKVYLIGSLPVGYEWVYVLLILLVFIIIASVFSNIFKFVRS